MYRVVLSVPMIILCLLLSACGQLRGNTEQTALHIRAQYLAMTGCSATAEVTADYGNRVYTYTMNFLFQAQGESRIEVTAPENVAGISVTIAEDMLTLHYDDVSLETGSLTEDGLSPMDALPALLKAIKENIIRETGKEMLGERDTVLVVYGLGTGMGSQGVVQKIWFDPQTYVPIRAEIAGEGRTAISCTFTQFSFS